MVCEAEKLEKINLGLVDYQDVYALQKKYVQERIADDISDRLLLLSHPPVVTIGKSGSLEDLFLSEKALNADGIQVCQTDRGGKTTLLRLILGLNEPDEGEIEACWQASSR